MINKESGSGVDADAERALGHARETVEKHLPLRIGECPACGSAAFCAPFTMALAILDRRDVPKARQIRTVLTVAGLSPPEFPHPAENGDDGWCEIVR